MSDQPIGRLERDGDAYTLVMEREYPVSRAEVFDRVWYRLQQTYGPDDWRWEELHSELRPKAEAAADDGALETVIFEMLKRRPALRKPASGRAVVSSAHDAATAAGVKK